MVIPLFLRVDTLPLTKICPAASRADHEYGQNAEHPENTAMIQLLNILVFSFC